MSGPDGSSRGLAFDGDAFAVATGFRAPAGLACLGVDVPVLGRAAGGLPPSPGFVGLDAVRDFVAGADPDLAGRRLAAADLAAFGLSRSPAFLADFAESAFGAPDLGERAVLFTAFALAGAFFAADPSVASSPLPAEGICPAVAATCARFFVGLASVFWVTGFVTGRWRAVRFGSVIERPCDLRQSNPPEFGDGESRWRPCVNAATCRAKPS